MQTRHKAPMFDELHNRNLKPPPLARIPIEVCEEIIDLIAFWALTHGGGGVDYGMYYATEWRFALIACAFVCKAWHTRSMYHLHSSVWLTNRDSVEFLFKRLLHDPELHTAIKHIIIRGPAQHGLEPFGGIPHFSTFIARLARQLPNVRTLRLCRAA
ncbi:uncharacterized protein B0H18DRAFT_287904 [Fomitopsis serialis]|uniref:uncharacterized protein n=1 Tax=Fomitopsis serialis TaxID=139415 RepID=UPI002008BE10|nr:uncharacterized protein B0H18DRAFT_287904 [Neoantrodia serialis]KAH9911946.1 hypothetical protein B0H18DRAFT_287904 [Neoantrodia serialis]